MKYNSGHLDLKSIKPIGCSNTPEEPTVVSAFTNVSDTLLEPVTLLLHSPWVEESLKANKLCAKCAQPTKLDPDCVNGACNNIKRDCFYCGSPSYLNILCF